MTKHGLLLHFGRFFPQTHQVTLIPTLLQHQQQVVTAVERAKQVSMTELNAIIGVSGWQCDRKCFGKVTKFVPKSLNLGTHF
jgi:hypothetical protein